MDDIRSGGVVLHYRVPKYGGYKVWESDADGDGKDRNPRVASGKPDGGGAGATKLDPAKVE